MSYKIVVYCLTVHHMLSIRGQSAGGAQVSLKGWVGEGTSVAV
jgi:hypothetical protein